MGINNQQLRRNDHMTYAEYISALMLNYDVNAWVETFMTSP